MTATGSAKLEQIRPPGAPWALMRFFVGVAIVNYAVASLAMAATWAVYAGFFQPALDVATTIDQVVLVSSFSAIGTYLVSAVFVAWTTFRCMKNAHVLGSSEEMMSPGWAVGWYFIPIATWFMPPRAVGQMWRATFAFRGENHDSAVVGWWWAAFIISNFMLAGTNALVSDQSSADQMQFFFGFASVAYALRLVAAWLLLVVFGTLTKAQSTLDRVAEVFT